MESPVPAPIQDESNVKKEESATSNDVQMTDAPESEAEAVTSKPELKTTESEPASVGSLATADGVTKDGYALMSELVHKLTEYRTEEYVN